MELETEMTAPAKIGYDGNPPSFSPKRGSEVRDRLTGAIVREGEMSEQNDNVDRLEWLKAHHKIEQFHHTAGRKLQGDVELAEFRAYTQLGSIKGGSGTVRLPDAKCDAIARVNAARAHVGSKCWRILELVVLENETLAGAESRMGLVTGNGRGVLLAALDVLATHYGLA